MPSVVNTYFFIFSPFFCSLLFCTIVHLSQCEMETSSSGLLGLLPAYLRLLEVFCGAPLIILQLPENTLACAYKGFLSMVSVNDFSLAVDE